ncbi:MAG: 50S ribosomal protein L19 [Candidatus Omnitrophica bacterium]|nr:50S ribosomal protein L19 [Candidatus Omnitrophota bacterium]
MNRQEAIRNFEKEYMKKEIPKFKVGDTVDVHVKIVEEGKKRIQVFEGVVIRKRGAGISKAFTVRKVSYGEGVERTFPLHSPNLEKIVVTKRGDVRRAKLYYLRGKIGKKTKIEGEDIFGKSETPPDAPSRKEGKEEGV